MNPDPKKRLFELFTAHAADSLTPAEHAELQEVLRTDAEARLMWFVHQDVEMGLHAHLEAAPISQPVKTAHRSAWLPWRPLTAAAAGIVFGMFCASVAWAYTSPRVVAEARRLEALVDESFEKPSGRVPSEFPVKTGIWSGDESEIVEDGMVKARDGRSVLRFLRAGGNINLPNSAAEACDVYQIVDLRPLREELKTAGESMLELSAEFLDARTTPGAPVVFACHIYLFEGSAESLHTVWPPAARDTLGVGASYSVSHGGPDGGGWRKVTARCVLTPQADVAVVKLSAGRGGRHGGMGPALGAQFADDVKLILKTQPEVPVRFVQH
jgi:hypothetical protein